MNIKNTLKHNCYSMHIVDKVIKKYFQENISEGNFHIIKKKILSKIWYIKLLYIAKFLEQLFNKWQILHKQYCKERNVKLVFTSLRWIISIAQNIKHLNTSYHFWCVSLIVQGLILAALVKHVATSKLKLMNMPEQKKILHIVLF